MLTMLKWTWPLLCCLCLAATARAETLRIGETDIPYTVPQGYVAGTGETYRGLQEIAAKVQPAGIRILALYADSDSHQKFLAKGGTLDNFFTLSTNQALEQRTLSRADFAQLRAAITSVVNQKNTEVASEANRLIDNATNGNLALGGMEYQGCTDDSAYRFSCLLLLTQLDRSDGKEHSRRQAALSTMLLSHGKLLMVNQYQLLQPDQDQAGQMAAFQKQAGRVLEELHIPEGAGGSGFFQGIPGRVLLAAVIGALIVGGLVWAGKRKTPAA